jgi:hypothetical protein
LPSLSRKPSPATSRTFTRGPVPVAAAAWSSSRPSNTARSPSTGRRRSCSGSTPHETAIALHRCQSDPLARRRHRSRAFDAIRSLQRAAHSGLSQPSQIAPGHGLGLPHVPAVSPAPDRRQPSKPQIPIEPASPLALPQPRFHAWALLGRRLDGVRGTVAATASEKPAPKETSFVLRRSAALHTGAEARQ